MSKRLIIILALAFVVGISVAAYAEVQNVKVSGDINVMGVGRNNLDLAKIPQTGGRWGSGLGTDYYGSSSTNGAGDKAEYFGKAREIIGITRLRVDADLTDNVSTSIRLLNERPWNGEGSRSSGKANANVGLYNTNYHNNESRIELDLAYVTMKEFLYSPLSLTVGRQLLRFGNGFIIGDPDTNICAEATALAEGDLSARKSFDAVRATLDYNPLVVDLIYGKVEEGKANLNDDVTLSGINASYDMGRNTVLEGFFFARVRGNQSAATYNLDAKAADKFDLYARGANRGKNGQTDRVYTIGGRVVNKSIKNLVVDVQGAVQLGDYNPKYDPNAAYLTYPGDGTPFQAKSGDREAWAAQLDLTYDLKDISKISKYSPVLGLNYSFFTGADRNRVGEKDYKGWDPMFEDQTHGHLMNAIMADTNMHRIDVSLSGKVTDDIGVKLNYVTAWFARCYPDGRLAVLSGLANPTNTGRSFRMGKESRIGDEIDLTLTYDYTEDVQFALLGGVFMPTNAINGGDYLPANTTDSDTLQAWPAKKAAGELIASMKVTF